MERNEKMKIYWGIYRAIKQKKIKKPNKCQICSKKFPKIKIDGHHEDYKKVLEVMWVCHKCHMSLHPEIGKETGFKKGHKINLGKKLSEEHKEKISKKLKGISRNGQHLIKKVKQYTKDGIFIREWNSMIEASKKTKTNPSSITLCCRGQRIKTAGGYKWSYLNKLPF